MTEFQRQWTVRLRARNIARIRKARQRELRVMMGLLGVTMVALAMTSEDL